MISNYHIPVFLNEVIESFDLENNDIVVDLTLGRAGHSQEIFKKIPKGFLIGVDKDKEAIEYSEKILEKIGNNFKLFHSDFKDIISILKTMNISKVDAILVDLGVSSPQIDNANRGFSYNNEAKLDMRMNVEQVLDAHYVVNHYNFEQLKKIFSENAEIKNSSQIAKIIVENRPINTTIELSEILKSKLPSFLVRKKNPSKAVFQAIRVEVNDEINSLKKLLSNLISILNKNGQIGIISFNSIEDRIVKNYFGQFIKNKEIPFLSISKEKEYKVKTFYPSKEEIEKNKRSKSAKLRVLKKVI